MVAWGEVHSAIEIEREAGKTQQKQQKRKRLRRLARDAAVLCLVLEVTAHLSVIRRF